MNNEELKKKICDIIAPYVSAYGDDERIADALIAAGICDVSNIILLADNALLDIVIHKAEVRSMEKRVKDAEHRAAMAERALDLCETAYILSLNHRATEGISGQAIASDFGIHKFFMKQAEKELAEERKDD